MAERVGKPGAKCIWMNSNGMSFFRNHALSERPLLAKDKLKFGLVFENKRRRSDVLLWRRFDFLFSPHQ
jgi:hypothetical protein